SWVKHPEGVKRIHRQDVKRNHQNKHNGEEKSLFSPLFERKTQ
ncbi:hypothetical protein HMPREF1585_01291, partial [Gardnerella vaginalis JCP8481B]